ncbi:urea transporter [Candidatus Daviesbacteria bacterium]|nr:urea transporter [Candidatus Daviesbacteria bacterium]
MNYIQIILNGFSQVMFQKNAMLGILMILGLLIASPQTFVLALLGNIITTFTGSLLGVERNALDAGFAGYNGVLIGAGISFYIKDFSMAFLLTILGSIIVSILFYLLFKNNIPPLAAPFVLITWGILIALKFIKLN